MNTSRIATITLLVLAAPLGACESSTARGAADAGADAALPATDGPPAGADAGDAAAAPSRTMIQRPLFGDTHPQNLFIDPNFSVRMGGLGDWQALTADTSQSSASWSGTLMTDSPAGLGMPVGHLADAKSSTGNFEITLVAQVAGGPGPFHLRVWVSTLDATASATLTGATVALLTSADATTGTVVTEDATKARVIAGRTWHLFTGQISQALSLGAFVIVDFPASTNTWLLQAPEFIPTAIDPSPTTEILQRRPAAKARPATAHERSVIRRYRLQPKLSVPAGHRALRDEPRPKDRR